MNPTAPAPPYYTDHSGPEPAGPAGGPGLAEPLHRHVPDRPSWICRADGRPWPCLAARVHLRSHYSRDQVGLSVYMNTRLMTAAVELAEGGTPPPDLFQRFVGWT